MKIYLLHESTSKSTCDDKKKKEIQKEIKSLKKKGLKLKEPSIYPTLYLGLEKYEEKKGKKILKLLEGGNIILNFLKRS
jgi:hypothetical protein